MDPFLASLFGSTRNQLRVLFEGDQLFLDGDDGGGSGGGSGGGGDGDDSDDDPGGDDGEPPEGSADDPGGRGDDDGDDDPPSREELRKLRSENQSLRKRAKTSEQELERMKSEGLSEQDRQTQELDREKEEKETIAAENRSLRVKLAATQVGIRPKAVAAAEALISWDDIDGEDDSAVTRALRDLKKDHGYLFAPSGSDADAGAGRKDKQDDVDVRPGRDRMSRAYAETKS